MVQTLKKVFSTFVTLTTILWSVGAGTLVLPMGASAATLSAGDLIKASGPAVYYYAADGKRYVFPNEKTYFAWYADFSSVKTITDGELAAVQIGGNVTIRPGTKLVKITTDPKTYAVTKGGTLHWIESEAVAKALYGDNWAQHIVDVPDGFFVNYTVGSSVSTNVHPDGTLIQYIGDASTYVVIGGMKRKFATDAAFAANGLNRADVMTTIITYGNGADVTGREGALADTITASGGTPVTGGLTVALASDTPAGMTVPKNSSSVPLVKVNLSAGGGDVIVTGMRFHRVGVGSTADFTNVYLYKADGTRLSSGRSINSSSNVVEFNGLNLTVSAGQTLSLLVYGDFSTPASTGGQHSLEVLDAASVVVSGAATVSGSFPVRGNVFTVGTTSAARVDVKIGSVPANPTIGAKQVEVSNFKLVANTNDVEIRQITLYQAGTVSNSDLTNFNLYQGTTLVATAVSVDATGHVVLKFVPAFVMANGSTRVFSLKADVAGRAGRSIRFYVEYTTDVTAVDRVYSAGANIDIATNGTFDGSGFTAGTTGCDTPGNSSCVATQGGQLTLAFNGPATQNIAKGQTAVALYNFAVTSPDNTLEIKKVVFTLAKTSGSACKVVGSAGTQYFRSIKIKNMDTGVTLMGPKETGAVSSTSETLTFTDSFNITAGQTMNLALVSDLYNGSEDVSGEFFTGGLCGYTATMAAFGSTDVRVTETGEFLGTTKIVPNSANTGNTLTVKASSLTVDLAASPGSDIIVKKQANVPVAGLVLTASAQSDITVTSLTLTGQAKIGLTSCPLFDAALAACQTNFATRVTSLALYDGATMVGLAKSPDTTTAAAQISNMNFVVPKGTSKTLTVKATLASTATNTTTAAGYDKIAVGVNLVGDISAQDQDSNTVTPTLTTAVTNQAKATAAPSVVQSIIYDGTLTVAADAHPASTIVLGCALAVDACPWVPFARYKATAQYEAISIDRVNVTSTVGATAADNADFQRIAIAQNGQVLGWDSLPSGISGSKDIDLSANPITVPKGGSANFEIWAKMGNIQTSTTGNMIGSARSGHAPGLALATSTQTGEWDANYASKINVRSTGVASGERLYAASGASAGNSMVLRKTMPIVTKQAPSNTVLSNIEMELMRFQIAADSAGSIAWKQAIFTYSKTAGVDLANFKLYRGTDLMGSATYAVTSGTSTTDLTANSLGANDTTGYIVASMAEGYEEAISGSGSVYSLRATVSGVTGSGKSVSLSFLRDSTSPVVTGYLKSTAAWGVFGSSANVFNLSTGAAPGAAAATGTFVWSDLSEVPHSSANATSRDWTNDLYVKDLTQTQTLSS